jgi:hypothetical protein
MKDPRTYLLIIALLLIGRRKEAVTSTFTPSTGQTPDWWTLWEWTGGMV